MGRRSHTTKRQRSRIFAVEVFLRRRKRLRAITVLLVLLAILMLVLLDHRSAGLFVNDDLRRYHGQTFSVVRVIDGDTIVVRVPDGDKPTTTIRVWGVNTPEMARHDGSKPAEPLAEEATALTRDLIAGGTVTLHLEPYRLRGRYGRVLAHVELADGSQLGARLIEAGLSPADDRWSHSQLTVYAVLELTARAKGVGQWAQHRPPGPMPIIPMRLASGLSRVYTMWVVAVVSCWGCQSHRIERTHDGIWPIKPIWKDPRCGREGDRGDECFPELGAIE